MMLKASIIAVATFGASPGAPLEISRQQSAFQRGPDAAGERPLGARVGRRRAPPIVRNHARERYIVSAVTLTAITNSAPSARQTVTGTGLTSAPSNK